LELYHQHLGIYITCIRDQGLEVIQIVIYYLTSLVVGDSFQSIDYVCFCIGQEEVNPELLLEVSLGLDGKNTSVHFLTEHISRLLGSMTIFEECESLENSLLFVVELLQGQTDIKGAGVQECVTIVTFSTEVQRTGELEMCLSRCQSRGWRY